VDNSQEASPDPAKVVVVVVVVADAAAAAVAVAVAVVEGLAPQEILVYSPPPWAQPLQCRYTSDFSFCCAGVSLLCYLLDGWTGLQLG